MADGERRVIERLLGLNDGELFAPAPDGLAPGRPGDDAAQAPGDVLVSVDTMVEGTHFDDRLSPEDVGWKLVAVNASDIGACGRLPSWALLSLALPRPLDEGWVQAFATGLQAALRHWSVALIGGDTTRIEGPRVASLTIGSAQGGPRISRSSAQPGELLWVSGTLGDAAAGFYHRHPEGLKWLRRPRPPVRLGAALGSAGVARAMMDLSDGLRADVSRMCESSGVGATIWPDALPAGPAVTSIAEEAERMALMTAFGEDYQLLFTASKDDDGAIRAIAAACGASVRTIGRCTQRTDGVIFGEGKRWPVARFAHF
ncbi:MAG: thiamine-phosphate kinase [Myxococcota bacterium]